MIWSLEGPMARRTLELGGFVNGTDVASQVCMESERGVAAIAGVEMFASWYSFDAHE